MHILTAKDEPPLKKKRDYSPLRKFGLFVDTHHPHTSVPTESRSRSSNLWCCDKAECDGGSIPDDFYRGHFLCSWCAPLLHNTSLQVCARNQIIVQQEAPGFAFLLHNGLEHHSWSHFFFNKRPITPMNNARYVELFILWIHLRHQKEFPMHTHSGGSTCWGYLCLNIVILCYFIILLHYLSEGNKAFLFTMFAIF